MTNPGSCKDVWNETVVPYVTKASKLSKIIWKVGFLSQSRGNLGIEELPMLIQTDWIYKNPVLPWVATRSLILLKMPSKEK